MPRSLLLQRVWKMGKSEQSVANGGKPAHEREPNGNRSIALAYIKSQCGSLFRRGFSLLAHRDKLYVRSEGTKIPLFLDLSASWQDVQRRAAALQDELAAGPYDPDAWRLQVSGGGSEGQFTTLDELETFWQTRKMAEGVLESTYRKDHQHYLRRLDQRRPLSSGSLMRAIAQARPGSRGRVRAVSLYRSVAKASGHPWNSELFDPLAAKDYGQERRKIPILPDSEIERIVLGSRERGDLDWWRVLALMATYGLRPWEAWVAEPSDNHPGCAWVPIGKRNSRGSSPPREVPPFHRNWLELFGIEEAWTAPLPKIRAKNIAGQRANRYMATKLGIESGSGKSSYAFRNAYARRIHSPQYRVTDGDGAVFMGHTVVVHNAIYRRWVAGYDDPVARYL